MHKSKLTLEISDLQLAICRIDPEAPLPDWFSEEGFTSITRTMDELSIVCAEELVPPDVQAERNWRIIKLKGSFDFYLTGVLASLITPLADAEIPVFAISSYDTDYLLLKNEFFEKAIDILKNTCVIE